MLLLPHGIYLSSISTALSYIRLIYYATYCRSLQTPSLVFALLVKLHGNHSLTFCTTQLLSLISFDRWKMYPFA